MKVKVKKIRPESKSSLKTAVKNVQKILKKEDKKVKVIKKSSTEKLPESELTYQAKSGIVCISHIPHGFFEEEMRGYFSQFGKVSRVRLVRSKRTGNSRGYGYVEFSTPEVAKIAAETMNNYLMANRLIKATYIPPEKQHFGFFFGKNITSKYYPRLKNRNKEKALKNAGITESKHEKTVKKSLKRLSTVEKKLKDKGIDFKFEAVDVPQS